ncbi:MAG: hypothetical protein Q4B42_04265 [Oscillospiraceae bacterium]|nr:hypothetical protein [Oscillospiraceae bacterium]
MPWIETESDGEFIEYVKRFEYEQKPEMQELLLSAQDKSVYIFRSRDEAAQYLKSLKPGLKD